jgi:VanZ family protein
MASSPGNNFELKGFFKYNLWGILWGLLIVLLTILPGKVFPRLPSFMDLLQPDKLVHVFIFAVYFFLQARGFLLQNIFRTLQKNAGVITLVIGLSLGAATEIIQELWVPMRHGDIYDFISDVVGILIGWGAYRYFASIRKERSASL